MAETLRIGELAARSGVSVRALRYYEQQGLIAPRRTPAGHRVFAGDHVERIARVRELFEAGFCSTVIRELLHAIESDDRHRLREELGAAHARLESEQRAIASELDALDALRRRLGLAPDVHVRAHDGAHEPFTAPTSAAPDHRDRRLR